MGLVTKSKKDGASSKTKESASPKTTATSSKKGIFSSSKTSKTDKKDEKSSLTPKGAKKDEKSSLTPRGTKKDEKPSLTPRGTKKDEKPSLTPRGTKKDEKPSLTPRGTKKDEKPSLTPKAKESTSSPKKTETESKTKSLGLLRKKTTSESPAPKEQKKSMLSKMRKSASPAPVPASSTSKPNLAKKSKGPTEGLPPIRKSKTPGPDLKKKSSSGTKAKIPTGSVELPKELLELEDDLKKTSDKNTVEETGRTSMDSVDSSSSKKKKKKRTFSFSGLTRKSSQSSLLSEGKESKEEESGGKEKKTLTNKLLGKLKITKNKKSKEKGEDASDSPKIGDDGLGLEKERSDQDSMISIDRSASENQSFSNATGVDTGFLPASESAYTDASESNYVDAVESQMLKASFTTKSSFVSDEQTEEFKFDAKINEMNQDDDKKRKLKTPEFEMLSDEEKDVIHQDIITTEKVEKENIEIKDDEPKEEILATEEKVEKENVEIKDDEPKEEISITEEKVVIEDEPKEEILATEEKVEKENIEIKDDEPKQEILETEEKVVIDDESKQEILETEEKVVIDDESKQEILETEEKVVIDDEPKKEILATEEKVEEETIIIKNDEPKEEILATEEKVEEETIIIKNDEPKEEILATEEKVEEETIVIKNDEPKEEILTIEEKVEEETIVIKNDEPKEEILATEEKVEEETIIIKNDEPKEEILATEEKVEEDKDYESPYLKKETLELYEKVSTEKEPVNYNDIKISQDFTDDCVPKASIDIFHAPAMDALVTAEVEGSLMMPTIFDKLKKQPPKNEDSPTQIQAQSEIQPLTNYENKQGESSVFIPINYDTSPKKVENTVIDEFEKDSPNEQPPKASRVIELLTAVDIPKTAAIEKKGENIETKLSELSDRAESYTTVIVASDRSEIDDFVKEEILEANKREVEVPVEVDRDEILSSGNESLEAILSDDEFDKVSEGKASAKSISTDDNAVENENINIKDDNSGLLDEETKRHYYPSFCLSKAAVSDDEGDEIPENKEKYNDNKFGSDFSLKVKTSPFQSESQTREINQNMNISMKTFPDSEDISPVHQSLYNKDASESMETRYPSQNINRKIDHNLSMHTFPDMEVKSPTCQSPPSKSSYAKDSYGTKKTKVNEIKEALSSDLSMEANDGFENTSHKTETEDDISIREYTPEVSLSMKLETENSGIDDNLSDMFTKDTPGKSNRELNVGEMKEMLNDKVYHGYRDDISDLSGELQETSSAKDVNIMDEKDDTSRDSRPILDNVCKSERYIPGAPEGISDLSSVDDEFNEINKEDNLLLKSNDIKQESEIAVSSEPNLEIKNEELDIIQKEASKSETPFIETETIEEPVVVVVASEKDILESKDHSEEKEDTTFTIKDRSVNIMELLNENKVESKEEEQSLSVEEVNKEKEHFDVKENFEDVEKEETLPVEETTKIVDTKEEIKENEVGEVVLKTQELELENENIAQDVIQGNLESKHHFEDIDTSSDQKRFDEEEEEEEEAHSLPKLAIKTQKHDHLNMQKIDNEGETMKHFNKHLNRSSEEDKGYETKVMLDYIYGYENKSRRKSIMSTTSSKNERTSICDYVVPGSPTKSVVSLAKQELIEDDLHQGCEKINEVPELSPKTTPAADKSKITLSEFSIGYAIANQALATNDKPITHEWLGDAFQATSSNLMDGTGHNDFIDNSEVKPDHLANEGESHEAIDSIPPSASAADLVQKYKLAKDQVDVALDKAKKLPAKAKSSDGDDGKGKNKSTNTRGIINIILVMTTLTVTTLYAILMKKPFSSAPDP